VVTQGTRLIRPVLVTASLSVSLKLLIEQRQAILW
jgi:hypothetical protein